MSTNQIASYFAKNTFKLLGMLPNPDISPRLFRHRAISHFEVSARERRNDDGWLDLPDVWPEVGIPVEKKRTEVQLTGSFLKGKKKARVLVSQQYRLTKHPKSISNLEAASEPPQPTLPVATEMLERNYQFQQPKGKKAKEVVSQQYRLAKHPKSISNLEAASEPPQPTLSVATEVLERNYQFPQLKGKKAKEVVSQQYRLAKPTLNQEVASTPAFKRN